jgi:hypothetical protein
MSNPKVKILVCTHKKAPCLNDDVYTPIQLGRSEVDYDLGFLTDLDGINIGDKHFIYSEYTAQYWAWKNLKGTDIVGFCHYRRYFCLEDKKDSFRDIEIIKEKDLFSMKISPKLLGKIFKRYDIILPKKKTLIESNWDRYSRMKDIRNLKIIETILEEKYPGYLTNFHKLLKGTNRLELLSIFITRWEVFDDYCKWLFSILEQAEKFTDPDKNTLHEERALAFLGELLLPVYVYSNNLKVKHLPVAWVNPIEINKSFFRYYASNIKSTIRFLFKI